MQKSQSIAAFIIFSEYYVDSRKRGINYISFRGSSVEFSDTDGGNNQWNVPPIKLRKKSQVIRHRFHRIKNDSDPL